MSDRHAALASPRNVAVIYAVISGVWILLSDTIVAATVEDPATVTRIQTVKGWAFVAGSALLVFLLVSHGQRTLARTNERLDRALQQSSILHRVLRHNLRNSCNVIAGNAELLADRDDRAAEDEECLEVIREQTERLAAITRKTRQLRDLVLEDRAPESIELVGLLERRIATARDRFPHATFDAELPGSHTVETHPRLELAVDELLENAVVHNDSTEPTVTVALDADGSATTIEIADDGPGLPDLERAVLEEGMEDPMFHSEGLGLWIARTVAVEAGGEVRIRDNHPRGTVVSLELS